MKKIFAGFGLILVTLTVYAFASDHLDSVKEVIDKYADGTIEQSRVTAEDFNHLVNTVRGINVPDDRDDGHYIGLEMDPIIGVDLAVNGMLKIEMETNSTVCNEVGTIFYNESNKHFWGCRVIGSMPVRLDVEECAVNSCTGTIPSNATLCAGDDQGLTQDTAITLVFTCTSTQKCEYTCDAGYHEDNGSCVQDTYSCTGTVPSNATLCAGDDQGLTQDVNITLVSLCTSTQKCEYTCDSGYHYDSSTQVCEPNQCTGTIPSNATLCAGDDQGLTQDTAISLVPSCTNEQMCEYECDSGYHYDAKIQACRPNKCVGTIPSNATLCAGDDQGLTQDVNITLVSLCTSTQKCEYTCDSGYHYDSSTQVCEPNQCTGTIPSNATLCAGDDQGLTQDTAISLVSSCTSTKKCEYTCDSGYHYDNGTCVVNAGAVRK